MESEVPFYSSKALQWCTLQCVCVCLCVCVCVYVSVSACVCVCLWVPLKGFAYDATNKLFEPPVSLSVCV